MWLLRVLQRDEREGQRLHDMEVKGLAENLHHLVSTKQIRGVFNPPPQFLTVRNLFPYLKDVFQFILS